MVKEIEKQLIKEAIELGIYNDVSKEINEVIFRKTIDIYKIARYTYKLGNPIIENVLYDKIAKFLRHTTKYGKPFKELGEIRHFLSNPYEEDGLPEESFIALDIPKKAIDSFKEQEHLINSKENELLLLEANHQRQLFDSRKILIHGEEKTIQELNDLISDLVDEDPPKSINPVESFLEAYDWFDKMSGKELVVSLKIDGINLRCFYLEGNLVLVCTRGRSGNIKIYTQRLSKIVPWSLKNSDGTQFTGIVRGECYGDNNKLEYLRQKYPQEYVVPRTAATTLLSNVHDERDYSYLKYTTFNTSVQTEKLEHKIDNLRSQGFDTVPYILTKFDGKTFEEFNIWVTDILNIMSKICKMSGIKADGIVCELNDPTEYEYYKKDGMYDEGNIALKIGPWQPGKYKAKLLDIIVSREEDSNEYSVIGIIEKTKMESGISVSRVNLFNMKLVMEANLKIGDEITFIFKNDNAIQWIYSEDPSKEI